MLREREREREREGSETIRAMEDKNVRVRACAWERE